MRLMILRQSGWRVVAEVTDGGECPMDQQLVLWMSDAKYGASATGFGALWDRIPKTGPKALGTALYHLVNDKHEIYEFVKGDLRLFCFEANNAVVVCSHLIRKRTQKTKIKDIASTIALKKRYLAAEKANNIKIATRKEIKSCGRSLSTK